MIRLLLCLIGYSALAQYHVDQIKGNDPMIRGDRIQQPTVPPVSEWITNITYEVVTVTNYHTNVVMRFPPQLTRFKSSTNLFRVTCPSCGVERAMPAKRIEVVGYRSVPEGNIHERHIFFTCCSEEFKAKSEKLVITPIAIELKP